MDDRDLHVLLIEKDADDARWISDNLVEGARLSWHPLTVTVTHADRLAQGVNHLHKAATGDGPSIDGIVIDPRFPESPSDEVLQTLRADYPHMPVVVLVSRGDESLAEALIPAGVRAILYKDESQGSLLAHALMHAIERQTDAQVLQEMVRRHQALFDQAHDAVFVLDLEGRHVRANRRAAEMLGYSDDEMQHLSYRDISAEPDQSKQVIDRLLRGERVPLYERRFRTKDGSVLPVEINVELVRDSEGRPQTIQSVVRDISARKRAEAEREVILKALRESEARYRALVETSPESIVLTDLEGRILFCNPQTAAMYGTDQPLDLVGKNIFSIIAPEHRARAQAYAERVFQGDVVQALEYKVSRVDGSQFFAEVSASLIKDDEGRPQAFIGITRDISRRRESEQAYRAVVDHSLQGLSIVQDKRLVFVNPATCALSGYTEEEFLAFSPEQMRARIHPDDRARIWHRIKEWFAYGDAPERIELRLLRKDGELLWIETMINRIEYHGRPAVQVTYIDITARKQAELEREAALAALEKSQVVLSRAERIANWGSWEWDLKKDVFTPSKGWRRVLGVETSSLSIDEIMSIAHPDDVEAIERTFDKAVEDDHPYEMEHRIIRQNDGTLRYVQSYGEFVRDENGDPVRMYGAAQDITERKHLELQREAAREALHESEERFRLAMEATRDGLWDWTVGSGNAYFSPGYLAILGYESDESDRAVDFWVKHVHPEDRETILQMNREYASNLRDEFEVEFRMQTREGEWIWIREHAKAVERDEDGRVTRVIGTITDVTGRKQAEIQREAALEALQESQRGLEDLSRRLVRAQENERRTLAHELHDEVGQVLAVVRLNLQTLQAESPQEAATAIRSCLDILDAAIGQMRNLSRELRPSLLDNLGLVPALRAFIDQRAQSAPFDATFTAGDLGDRLPKPLEDAYFRIVQEAMVHVIPYADADHVALDLRVEDETLTLTLRHDGMGFDIEEALVAVDEEISLGLATMRERAYLLGGMFQIQSEPDAGTEIRIQTPVEPLEAGT